MPGSAPLRFHTIASYRQYRGMQPPAHPLISVMNLGERSHEGANEPLSLVFDFYSIALKRIPGGKLKYGQQSYDFDEGLMFFIAPGQVFSVEIPKGDVAKRTGWVLLLHPDFLWGTPLAKKIRDYDFFSYSVHEALHLSAKEEATLGGIIQNIEGEYHANIDRFSQDVIIAQLELLLTYGERFYHRQFITRRISNHQILDRLEALLAAYFSSRDLASKGMPTVQYVAEALHVSPGYLGTLLRQLTGLNTQQHIQARLIEKAKERISTTRLSVSEIAYELGFGHSQSFSKLFKAKTGQSPLAFRQAFG